MGETYTEYTARVKGYDDMIGEHFDTDVDRFRAAEARHGGRYITGALAGTIDRSGDAEGVMARFAGWNGPEELAEAWRYSASPSGSEHGSSGRETTARYAQGAARIGGVDWEHSAYWRAPTLPESAFDWPIYRAATTPDWTALDIEYQRVFEMGRGRFREGMSIARRIYDARFA